MRSVKRSCFLTHVGVLALSATLLAEGIEGQASAVSDRPQVILLEPVVVFSDYETGAALQAELYGSAAYADRLRKQAVKRFKFLELEYVDQESITDSYARKSAAQLQANEALLARGVVPESARDLLRAVSVAANSSRTLILAQHMKVKLGPNARWSPESGLMGPRMTVTQVQSALIWSRTGQVAWQGQAFLRALPGVNSSKFDRLLDEAWNSLQSTPR